MKYSYSQIKTFGSCQYKWHLNYKEGLVPPPSNVMSFGKFGHKMIENVLLGQDILHDIVVGQRCKRFKICLMIVVLLLSCF